MRLWPKKSPKPTRVVEVETIDEVIDAAEAMGGGDISFTAGPPAGRGTPGALIAKAYRKDGREVEVLRFYDGTLYYRRVPVWCWWALFLLLQGAVSGAAVALVRWGS